MMAKQILIANFGLEQWITLKEISLMALFIA
jgi:hypothetical protein